MVRFQADVNLHGAIRIGCKRREPEMDFQSARESGLDGVTDNEVLSRAAEAGRILVTLDKQTMPSHFGEFLASGGTSAGVFLVRRRAPILDVIEDLLLAWVASEAKEWENRFLEIPFR
jgi:predicted nuclease of predicted toxin-antitoxin system